MIKSTLTIQPPVIAHRGLSGRAPENTLISFSKAAQAGVKWVEFDVMLASCGTPIVFHDETLQRVAGIEGNVSDYPYSYLSTLDVGSWFDPIYASETIPTLEAVLQWLKNFNMNANIEIKALPGQDVETVLKSLPIIERYFPQPTNAILFSSFSAISLRALREAMPDALLGYLIHDEYETWREVCDELRCISVDVNHEIVTPDYVRDVKASGRQVLCYTVNSIERAKELFAMGVDGVFSDISDEIMVNI